MRLSALAVVTLVLPFSHSLQIHVPGITSRRKDGRLLLKTQANESFSDPYCTDRSDRRSFLWAVTATAAGVGIFGNSQAALAEKLVEAEETEKYDNPNIPAGPEERSGLVVLRVAEVCQFQEKLIRAVVNGDIHDVTISPQQIVFGTKILLRNSNIAGNMKLMIDQEIPRQKRAEAASNAATVMNTLQTIYSTADSIQRPFSSLELLLIADLYRDVRFQLNDMYEYLPQKEKDKYYGYFMAVTEYEKKIADGVYNPDIDGILKFD